jgi:hypothetical protein
LPSPRNTSGVPGLGSISSFSGKAGCAASADGSIIANPIAASSERLT